MSSNDDSRVLSRRRARELAQEELDKIFGSESCCTRATLIMTGTPKAPDENYDS
jgi:hypothetical protein